MKQDSGSNQLTHSETLRLAFEAAGKNQVENNVVRQNKQVELPEETKKQLWETQHYFKSGVNERMYRHSDVEALLIKTRQEAVEEERKRNSNWFKPLYKKFLELEQYGILQMVDVFRVMVELDQDIEIKVKALSLKKEQE